MSLSIAGYQIKTKWRENDLLTLNLIDKDKRLQIKLLDSLILLPFAKFIRKIIN
jgi:hypothetical protein